MVEKTVQVQRSKDLLGKSLFKVNGYQQIDTQSPFGHLDILEGSQKPTILSIPTFL